MSDVLANDNTARTASFVFVVQLIVAIAVMYYILKTAKYELDKHINDEHTKATNSLFSDDFNESGGKKKCSFCDNLVNIGTSNCESCKLLNPSSTIQMA